MSNFDFCSYGVDSGIVSTVIAQENFREYFDPFTAGIKGAVVSTFNAGSIFGVFFAAWTADAIGRKRTIAIAAAIAVVAGIIQAASIHIGMLIAGRIIGGFAVGMMNISVPIFNSEIAPPAKRGMIAGLHAQFVGFGFAAANVRKISEDAALLLDFPSPMRLTSNSST